MIHFGIVQFFSGIGIHLGGWGGARGVGCVDKQESFI